MFPESISPLTLTILPIKLAIHRLPPNADIPSQMLKSELYAVVKTDEELSIVCDVRIPVESLHTEGGWSGIKVIGSLDFSLTGILADLAAALAEADISVFAISTYETDYLLVKTARLQAAVVALEKRGHRFTVKD
jgi:hypothetical protein